MLGVCAVGHQQCQNSMLTCVADNGPGNEVCDGLDNDCDTGVDEGNPGGGQACLTGMLGNCANGTTACSSGQLQCNPNNPATNEVCVNGIDEDCDGTADDGCPCAHNICVIGAALFSQCSACVTTICNADPFCCNNSWDGQCVGEVSTLCGQNTCWSGCAHNWCAQGGALANGCDAGGSNCAAQICGVDPFCCSNTWDNFCVGEVASVCGITC
jgi:hypothetical protein